MRKYGRAGKAAIVVCRFRHRCPHMRNMAAGKTRYLPLFPVMPPSTVLPTCHGVV
ncbi:MAG: hypothetical protein IKD10_07880 [Lentisphaeria bacterium]|nr:hypothetical protein [Lentisphaeria bacterium]